MDGLLGLRCVLHLSDENVNVLGDNSAPVLAEQKERYKGEGSPQFLFGLRQVDELVRPGLLGLLRP